MIPLSKRLRLIASFVPEGAAVCDVGTDHGYLPAALAKSGRCRSVIATDLREKPLASARENLRKYRVENVCLRLCDGLSDVRRDEIDTVIIAGMGGEVIAGIMERCSFAKERGILWILQPMTSAECLRDYLAENGFHTEQVIALSEEGKHYCVLTVRFDGTVRTLSPMQRYVGDLENDSDDAAAYIRKQYRRCIECVQQLSGIASEAERCREYQTAAAQMKEKFHGI